MKISTRNVSVSLSHNALSVSVGRHLKIRVPYQELAVAALDLLDAVHDRGAALART